METHADPTSAESIPPSDAKPASDVKSAEAAAPKPAAQSAASPEDAKTSARKRGVPEGLWLKCDGCGASLYRKLVQQHLNV